MRTGDPDPRFMHLDPGDAFGGGDGLPHRRDGALEVDDHPFAEPVRRHGAFTDNVEHAVTGDLTDDGANLCRADIQTDDNSFVGHSSAALLVPFILKPLRSLYAHSPRVNRDAIRSLCHKSRPVRL